MGSKRTKGAGGSAAGKPTDLTPKKGAQRAIESSRTGRREPLKAGRNMGGRDLLGQRVRGRQGRSGT